jgi:DNA-directed RNA polymerase subunit RPC12/RpoP
MICNDCGRHISMAYVAMVDECPGCGASPVVEKVAPDPEQLFVNHANGSHDA